jgi:putative ABC transport system permease protein
MSLWAILKVAFRSLRKNKMRSALTMLGIIIGVGAVIAMVSIGQGANAMVQDQIASIGTNILFVWAGSHNAPGGVRQGAGTTASLTAEDVQAMEREIPTIAAASPVVRSNAQIIYGNQNWGTQIQGTNAKFCQIRRWPMAEGEFFTDGDVRASARVAVLGQTVVDNLFPGMDPTGQTIRVRNLPFQVVGVLASKGQSLMGQDQDDLVIMPYTTVQKKLLGQTILSISSAMVSCISQRASRLTEQQITDLLRQRHHIKAGEADDFSVRNMSDIAETAQQTNQVMTMLLGSIAAVSLLVGGIGIMNIMLVSVTERTREIGIRMAIGARPGHIRLQFLTESVVLSLMGGAVGILLGTGLSMAIADLLKWPTLLSSLSMMVSFGFSAAVGVFFGYYPAHKAASLDPIEALHYE